MSQAPPKWPYVGLRPFTEQDREYFFGREEDAEMIAANLITAPLTVLYGASGVGKSSVLLAGVVPYLRAMPELLVVPFRKWQDRAFRFELMAETVRALRAASGQTLTVDEAMPLDEFLARVNQTSRRSLAIVLDQFEEYFLYHPEAASGNRFDAEFARAVNREDVEARFLISMREDALSRLDRFQGRIPNLLSNYLRLKHLDAAGARRAIVKPLEVYNQKRPSAPPLTIEPALVERLIADVRIGQLSLAESGRGAVEAEAKQLAGGDERIEASFLQMVLQKLWEADIEPPPQRGETAAPGYILRASTYDRLEGAPKIVSTYLHALMNRLSPTEQSIAAKFFDRLVTPSGTKIAQRSDDLIAYAAAPAQQVLPVLKLLDEARVLNRVASPLDEPNALRYEIFHDVLAPAALAWRTSYLEKQAQEQARREEQERQEQRRRAARERLRRQRVRFATVGGLGLLLVLIISSLLLYLQNQDLDRARATAIYEGSARATAEVVAKNERDAALTAQARTNNANNRARSIALAVRANSQLAFDPELSLLLAREALAEDDTAEAEDAVRRALFQPIAFATLRGHEKHVESAVFSPNGKRIVTASEDGTARVWDAATGDNLFVLRGDGKALKSAIFSPDGKYILTLDKDKTARVSDAATGIRIGQPLEHTSAVYSATFSPDSALVVTATRDKKAIVWDARTGEQRIILDDHSGAVGGAAFSHDGKYLATRVGHVEIDEKKVMEDASGSAKRVRVWDTSTWKLVRELGEHTSAVLSVTFSPDDKFLLTAGADMTARIWDMATVLDADTMTVASRFQLSGHSKWIYKAIFSPDGKYIATVSDDRTAMLWDTSTGRRTSTSPLKHDELVRDVDFTPDSKWVVTASWDGTAQLWEVTSAQRVGESFRHTAVVKSAAFSADGKWLVTASDDGTARLWEVQPWRQFDGHTSYVADAVYDAAGKTILSLGGDNTVHVWDAETAQVKSVINGYTPIKTSSTYSPDGKWLATVYSTSTVQISEPGTPKIPTYLYGITTTLYFPVSSPDRRVYVISATNSTTVTVYDARTYASISTLKGITTTVKGAVFSPDNKYVLMTSAAGNTARVWDVSTGKLVRELGHANPVTRAAFSPDSQFVITASNRENEARVWQVPSGQKGAFDKTPLLQGHTGGIFDVAFSADGKFVVTASADKTARVWETRNWQTVQELRGHAGVVTGATFSPDGLYVLTASLDHTARVWALAMGDSVHTLSLEATALKLQVTSAALSPDGKFAATTNALDNIVNVWDVSTDATQRAPRIIAALRGYTDSVTSLTFSRDARAVLAIGADGTRRMWDVGTQRVLSAMNTYTATKTDLAFSPDGKWWIWAYSKDAAQISPADPRISTLRAYTITTTALPISYDSKLRLQLGKDSTNIAATGVVTALKGITATVIGGAFSPDNKYLLTASKFLSGARLWDTRSGELLAELPGHANPVTRAAFSPDSQLVITTSERENEARVWQVPSGRSIVTLQEHTGGILDVAFSADGKFVVTASADKTARVWETRNWQTVRELRGHDGVVTGATFSPDGLYVLTASLDHTARVWALATGDSVHVLRLDAGAIASRLTIATLSPDGSLAVVANNLDNIARVWDVKTERLIASLPGHRGQIKTLAFSADGKFVVTASADKTARLWDTDNWTLLHELRGHKEAINGAVFDGNSRYVVTTSDDFTARIWEIATGKSKATLSHNDKVYDAAFTRDGRLVVTASGDNTARVWSTATGESLTQLRGHIAVVRVALFSPDSRFILTASTDRTLQLYPCDACGSLQQLRALVRKYDKRDLTCEERQVHVNPNISCPTPTPAPVAPMPYPPTSAAITPTPGVPIVPNEPPLPVPNP